MSARARPLPPLEIAIGRRGAALAHGGTESPFIATHIEQPESTHSRPACRKICPSPSSSARRFTSSEPGDTRPGTTALRPAITAAASAQVLDAGVGAGTDKHAINVNGGQRSSGLETHIGKGVARGLRTAFIRYVSRIGSSGVDGGGLFGAGPPQVTVGATSRASNERSASNFESRRCGARATLRPHARASPVGARASVSVRRALDHRARLDRCDSCAARRSSTRSTAPHVRSGQRGRRS